MAKHFYRLLAHWHIRHRDLLKGLYAHTQQLVAQQAPEYVIVALDPVNFEKPYCQKVEGIYTVLKSTPPALGGKKRLTKGYPAMTATIVNPPEPTLTYTNWFSYTTADFLSQNREIERAIHITRALLPTRQVRFVGDAGLDDSEDLAGDRRGVRYSVAFVLTLILLGKLVGEVKLNGIVQWMRLRKEWVKQHLGLERDELPCRNLLIRLCCTNC